MTETWPQVTHTENLMKFKSVVFEIWEWTDRQTNIQTQRSQYFAPLWGKVTINKMQRKMQKIASHRTGGRLLLTANFKVT